MVVTQSTRLGVIEDIAEIAYPCFENRAKTHQTRFQGNEESCSCEIAGLLILQSFLNDLNLCMCKRIILLLNGIGGTINLFSNVQKSGNGDFAFLQAFLRILIKAIAGILYFHSSHIFVTRKATAHRAQSYGCFLPDLTRFDETSRDGGFIVRQRKPSRNSSFLLFGSIGGKTLLVAKLLCESLALLCDERGIREVIDAERIPDTGQCRGGFLFGLP